MNKIELYNLLFDRFRCKCKHCYDSNWLVGHYLGYDENKVEGAEHLNTISWEVRLQDEDFEFYSESDEENSSDHWENADHTIGGFLSCPSVPNEMKRILIFNLDLVQGNTTYE